MSHYGTTEVLPLGRVVQVRALAVTKAIRTDNGPAQAQSVRLVSPVDVGGGWTFQNPDWHGGPVLVKDGQKPVLDAVVRVTGAPEAPVSPLAFPEAGFDSQNPAPRGGGFVSLDSESKEVVFLVIVPE